MSELYVNYSGLDDNIEELRRWKEQFNTLNNEFNQKLNEMNNYWQGADYNTMKSKVTSELAKITGSDGKIQQFITDCINDLSNKKEAYTNIQRDNANYWE